MKSDRNGIEGKLLAAEGGVEVVGGGGRLKKQNGDGEIGAGGSQTAAAVRLRPLR